MIKSTGKKTIDSILIQDVISASYGEDSVVMQK
jgi:hypothetical protein